MYELKRPLTLLWLHIQLSSPDVEMYWAPGPGWMEVHLSPLPSQRIRVSESGFCKPFHPPLCWPAKLTDNARLLTSNELYIFSLLIKSSSFHHCLYSSSSCLHVLLFKVIYEPNAVLKVFRNSVKMYFRKTIFRCFLYDFLLLYTLLISGIC